MISAFLFPHFSFLWVLRNLLNHSVLLEVVDVLVLHPEHGPLEPAKGLPDRKDQDHALDVLESVAEPPMRQQGEDPEAAETEVGGNGPVIEP